MKTDTLPKNEIPAWELHLNSIKTESEMAQKKLAETKNEIQFALTQAQKEMDRMRDKSIALSKESEAASEELKANKAEFESILSKFNVERDAFNAERTKMTDRDTQTKAMRERLVNFVVWLRRETDKL